MNDKNLRSRASGHVTAGLLLSLLVLGAAACNGGSSNSVPLVPIPSVPDPVVREGDPLPGVVVAIQRVYGGSGPNGAFRVGDRPKIDFTVKRDDGVALELSRITRAAILVSGPTENYQRVIPSQSDLGTAAVKTAVGEYTYTFAAPLPATYLAPLNDSPALSDGEWTGQPLAGGTYTVGIELCKTYVVEGTEYRDPGNATADFLFGSATTIAAREFVKNENCTVCHSQVRAHGDERIDVRQCLLCHTAGAEDGTGGGGSDATPGATIDFRVMIHKIHSGRHLPSVLGVTTNPDGTRKYDATPKPYQLIGEGNEVSDFSAITFPAWPSFTTGMPRDFGHTTLSSAQQSLENTMRAAPVGCGICHGDPDGAGPLTAPAQGDLIWARPSRRTCTSCHDDWEPSLPYMSNGSSMPPQANDSECSSCHLPNGDPMAVEDAHRHPLVDPALAAGVHFDVTAVVDVGGNNNGNFDPGERVAITFSVKNDAGTAIPASSLSRIEAVLSGPTTNPQMMNYQRMAPVYFSGAGPYTVNMPTQIYYDAIGTSTGTTGETFTSSRAPIWNVSGAATSLLRRTGVGASSTLAASARVTQNYIDVAFGTGSMFVKDNYIVLDDAVSSMREYLRIQWVQGDRLWFGSQFRTNYKPNLLLAHAAGATVQVVTTSAIPTASWTLVPATGVFTEVVEFGSGAVLASYTSDFVIPPVYPGALDDSPVNGEDWGDWTGLPLVNGTYKFDLHGARSLPFTGPGGEMTTYTEAAEPTVVYLLFGAATSIEIVERVVGATACNACHVNLQFHGGSRRGFDACINCHGSAGAENTLLYENPTTGNPLGTPVEFRYLLHQLHEHVFPVTPGGVQDCSKCHGPGNTAWQVPAERNHPSQSRPTRAWKAACSSCHDSAVNVAHIDANTSASGGESCAICHGAGRELDVPFVHLIR